jgi:D-sedoheptulose 7-phosphate isomerase
MIALSTSGNSNSILNAIEKAKDLKLTSVLFTSIKYTNNHADLILKVSSTKTEQIQHAHTAIGHILCELIEQSLLP